MPATTAKTPARLVFERVDNKLSVSVNGVIVGSLVMKLQPDVSKFINAPLRFGANHQLLHRQNLNVDLSKIVLLSSTFDELAEKAGSTPAVGVVVHPHS